MNSDQPATVQVLYFAALQDAAQRSSEEVALRADMTGKDLYETLATRYSFSLPMGELRLAINQQFANFDQPLQAGDEVAFIPPVAGG